MRETIDLRESYDGDLIFSNGDFADTEDDYSAAAYQLVRTILNTKKGENDLFYSLGFDADSFEGKPNDERTGKLLAKSIKNAIIENTYFYQFEVEVNAFPVGKHTIAVKIRLDSVKGKTESYTVAYDTRENKLKSLVFNEFTSSSEEITINRPVSPTINSRA